VEDPIPSYGPAEVHAVALLFIPRLVAPGFMLRATTLWA
jgi:hypothetical protein